MESLGGNSAQLMTQAEESEPVQSFTSMEESFTTFNHVDMKIIKKHAIYNNLNLANLARKCKLKIKVKENKDDDEKSDDNREKI